MDQPGRDHSEAIDLGTLEYGKGAAQLTTRDVDAPYSSLSDSGNSDQRKRKRLLTHCDRCWSERSVVTLVMQTRGRREICEDRRNVSETSVARFDAVA